MTDIPALLDVAIIGAGFYGLKAAQTYLKLDPDAKLAIFERYNTVGGTWSRDRIYPSLVAQVEYGYFNYPDTPMPKDGATGDNLVSGNMIFNYLDRFASEHDLKSRIHFESWVSNVERCNQGWRLTVNGKSVESRKLIVASGITSVKNPPSFEVKQGSIPVIHSIDIARNVQDLSSDNVQHCLVLGAAKSAYDVVYELCSSGKKVTWVIRPDGSGPMPIMPTKLLGVNTITLSSNRLTNYLSPSLMTTDSWLGSLFHRTALGRWLTKAHWNFITSRATQAAGFGGNAGSVEGLIPDIKDASCFWCDSSLGLITLGDFWSRLQKGNITIIRDNVDIVDASGALLRSGRRVDVDRVIYCTGWGDHFSFFSEAMKEELGIPQYGAAIPSQSSVPSSKMNEWRVHEEAADMVVAQKLPLLASGPKDLRNPNPNRCVTRRHWRLYNRCVPLSTARNEDRSIVILGQIHTTQTPTISAVQCLWAVAYLLGEVPIPTEDCMVKEVTQWNAWTRKRYSSVGERYPYALFDWIPYLDRLLRDLGVRTQRKKGTFANFLAPHGPSDYDGVLDEYVVMRKKHQNADN
ncbi:flavin-binding monooxygenase-like family protein [Xylaria digitata]|nr:flavin-binding monooxygenase-like family protein [Xylaria digitata]